MSGAEASCTEAVSSSPGTLETLVTSRYGPAPPPRIASRSAASCPGGVLATTKPGQVAAGSGNVCPARQRRHLVAPMDAGEVLRTHPGHDLRRRGASGAGGKGASVLATVSTGSAGIGVADGVASSMRTFRGLQGIGYEHWILLIVPAAPPSKRARLRHGNPSLTFFAVIDGDEA